jgi:hypothetical protein
MDRKYNMTKRKKRHRKYNMTKRKKDTGNTT